MDLHRIGARKSPKQAKNEIIEGKLVTLFIVRFLCLVVSVMAKS